MCGICGIYNFGQEFPELDKVNSMMSLMKHRGPDDEGLWNDDKTVLGFVRLSILDLSHEANQPMVDESGK